MHLIQWAAMKKVLPWFSALFGFGIFLAALWVIRKQLHGHTMSDIFAAANTVPSWNLFLALLLTALCYLLLTGYDMLAARALHPRPLVRSIVLNSFICHAMSVNVGVSWLAGGSIRCHYYLRKGVGTTEVIRIVSFCIGTFWLGFIALGGTIFLLAPPEVPSFIHLPFSTLRPLGALLLLALAAYFFLILLRREPVSVRGWLIPVIPAHITVAQIVIAASEWILGAAVLHILLPNHPELTYLHLLSFYFLAQISGLVSQVPSGLGVFESILLALAPSDLDPSRILGSLLMYRLIFNLLPLFFAGSLLLVREVRYRNLVIG